MYFTLSRLAGGCWQALVPAVGYDPQAGFTNQKPARRTPGRFAPWVKVVSSRLGLAPRAEELLQSAYALVSSDRARDGAANSTLQDEVPTRIAASVATEIYRAC
jgi:hypothetical protein